MTPPDAIDAAGQLASNVARVRDRIAAAGGDAERVTLVAVTKGFGAGAVEAARRAGLGDLGENYAQELLEKAVSDDPTIRWHFLGRLQTNKVRRIAHLVDVWQSVDRGEVVVEIARRAPGSTVLVQLNLADDPGKGGCPIVEAPRLVALARESGLDVSGLMGVGPAGDADGTRRGFEHLVALADSLELPERSIGMSGDLELAIAAGSTMVRIGRDLFGERPGTRG